MVQARFQLADKSHSTSKKTVIPFGDIHPDYERSHELGYDPALDVLSTAEKVLQYSGQQAP